MATYMPNGGLEKDLEVPRVRRISERSDIPSETELPNLGLRRRRFLRSVTDTPFINLNQGTDDEAAAPKNLSYASRENLSQRDSSNSGDQPTGPDNFKLLTATTTTTSQEESEESPRKSDQAGTRSGSAAESRQNSGERTSRQDSHTEPEETLLMPKGVTWAEPQIMTKQRPTASGGANPRSLLLAMRAEYTSITDSLENYCDFLSPPRTPPVSPPPSRERHKSEMSNPELAWQLENEHLRVAEEFDYLQMEDLIHRRYGDEEETNLASDSTPFSFTNEHQMRQLRRASAIDEDSRRPPPTISVTRELEQTLSRPLVTRDSENSDSTEKAMATKPAPASETMC